MNTNRKPSVWPLKLTLPALLALLPLLVLGSGVVTTQAAIPTNSRAKAQSTQQVLVLRVYFRDAAERDRLATEVGAEEVSTRGGYITKWADQATYNDLRARGLRVEIDDDATRRANIPIQWRKDNPLAKDNPDTFYGGYRTVEEIYQFLDQQVAAHPTLAQVEIIGQSWCKTHPTACTQPAPLWTGFDLKVLHITNQAIAGPKPVFWYDAGIHSREIATPEVAMRFINYLLSNYDTDADAHWLVDYQDIWVMPTLNPDGHHMVESGGNNPTFHRKNADRDDGCSTYDSFGTDINRNYPFVWGCCGGSSSSACSDIYRGPAQNSEEETQAVVTKVRSLVPDQRGPNQSDLAPITTTGTLINMHSNAQQNLYPWGYTSTIAPNQPDLRNIGRHMSSLNVQPVGNNYEYCQNTECLYVVDGDEKNWMYGELGSPAYSLELAGSDFFPPYPCLDNPTGVNGCTDTEPYIGLGLWPQNKGALLYHSKIARTPYLLTRGPDTNVASTAVTTTQGSAVQIMSTINYAWNGARDNQPNNYLQNVAAAEYYVDTPPWAGGTGVAMTPVDGSYNSPTEQVEASVPTGSLSVGRHIVFMRGRGVNDYGGFGSWGPVSAIWLYVTAGGTPTPTTTGTPPTATPTRTNTAVPPTSTSTSTTAPSSTSTRTNTSVATATCVPAGSTQDVSVDDFFFAPQSITIPAGTTIRWTNVTTQGIPHTTTSDTSVWDSGTLNQGGQFSHTFNTPGTFTYHCNFHKQMIGTITVQAGGLCATSTATRTNTPVPPSATRTTAPTQTPGGPSATTAPTQTPVPPSSTPTTCTITFTDVDPDNTFYQFIRCLACRGIISGYSDGTFRPFNDITRGQIAKMVSNSAGFEEDPGPQVYEDVPEASPFYQWINRLSNRGHMGGYPCGLLPEEPCIEPGNLPYFRPANSATRGQLAKIVANAAGNTDPVPAGTQTYTDVDASNPFYLYIERLTALGVMSGYECGGEGEPCDSENRPYFRPFNNVTRGQASKIVANTFFPGCQTPARPTP